MTAEAPGQQFSNKQLRTARTAVRRILAHYFGKRTSDSLHSTLTVLTGGLTNLVFSVRTKRDRYVIRMSFQPDKLVAFMKEQWAIAAVRQVGVPTPEVLEVGNEVAGTPYMISKEAKGAEATWHPERPRILHEMGQLAARIHSVKTGGFGATFEWSHNQLSRNETWAEFLTNELKLDDRLKTLADCGMLGRAQITRLRKIVEHQRYQRRKPGLNHGDLRLKNMLVDKKGRIQCVLDWEHCTSNLVPEWDLSLALHDLSIDEKQYFLEGYGMKSREFEAAAPMIKALNVINYAPAVAQASATHNGFRPEHFRQRLQGLLDLYSF